MVRIHTKTRAEEVWRSFDLYSIDTAAIQGMIIVTTFLFLLFEITRDDFWMLGAAFFSFLVVLGTLAGAVKSIKSEFWVPIYEKLISPWIRNRALLRELGIGQKTIQEQLEVINKELRTNGGNSLKDSVTRIEENQEYFAGKLQHIAETSGIPYFEMDAAANIVYANRELCEIYGADPEDMKDRRWVSKLESSEKEKILTDWNICIQNKCSYEDVQTIRLGEGKKIRVRVQGTPRISRVDKTLLGFFGRVTKIED